MEDKKSAKKKKRSKDVNESKAKVLESDNSDAEVSDYGNGHEVTMIMNEMDDSVSSDGGWNSDDDQELVDKVKSSTKENDKVNYKTRLKQLDWKEIAFKNYSPEDCEKRFMVHLKHVRRYRNLNEIAVDIESNIKKCPLKKPLNSYQIFVKDQLMNATTSGDFAETMRNLATRYKTMPREERLTYEQQAAQLRQEYKLKKMELTSGNLTILNKTSTSAPAKIKTPFMLYAEDHAADTDYSKMREDYNNLKLDEKYKFVIKAVSLAPDEPVTKILNKDEQRIFKGQIKQSPSAYSLFVKDIYVKMKEKYGSKDIFVEIAQRWKSLDADQKQVYLDRAAELKVKAAKEQQAFNDRHGVTPKGRRRKSVYIEPPLMKDSDDDDEEEQQKEAIFVLPKPKKRKASGSSNIESSSDETRSKQIKIESKSALKSPLKSPVKSPMASPMKSPIKSNSVSEIVNHSPSKDAKEKKKPKLKSISESSDFNDKVESDAASSSTSTGSKKKSKKEKKEEKEKKEKTAEPPGEKPPSTLEKYFAKFIHTGKPHKAQKAFNKLTKREMRELKVEYNEKVEMYVNKLKIYLASLSKQDAINYIAQVKDSEDAEANNDQGGSSQEY